MKTDSFCEIGSTHETCQDYTLDGLTKHYAYAVLCDGCSGSNAVNGDVDVGVRVLANTFKKSVEYCNLIEEDDLLNIFKYRCLYDINSCMQLMDLSYASCDATLLCALLNEDGHGKLWHFGDGLYDIIYKDGTSEFVDVNCLSGTPPYLSYFLDKKRLESYLKDYGDTDVVINRYFYDSEDEFFDLKVEIKTINDIMLSCPAYELRNVERVSLLSDGFHTFTKDNEAMDFKISTHDYLTLKNTNGVFVERRFKSRLRNNLKNNIKHFDDISMASIIL